MKTEAEIREQIAALQIVANGPEHTPDRETARNLCHTLTWVIGDNPHPSQDTRPPIDLLGWITTSVHNLDAVLNGRETSHPGFQLVADSLNVATFAVIAEWDRRPTERDRADLETAIRSVTP